MTNDTAPQGTGDLSKWLDPGHRNAQLIYILFFLGFITGITVLVGVVLAYVNRGKADSYVETHYTWLIRTFWMGLLLSFVSALLSIILIGFLLMIAVAVWVLVRLVKGLQLLSRNEDIPDPETWLI